MMMMIKYVEKEDSAKDLQFRMLQIVRAKTKSLQSFVFRCLIRYRGALTVVGLRHTTPRRHPYRLGVASVALSVI